MPVIVVGADAPLGIQIVDALLPRAAEVRAFVTDRAVAAALKARRVKVAIGDVSDGSHVGIAAQHAFCAVLIGAAATDGRERSFASRADEVITGWAQGLADAGTTRVVLVHGGEVNPAPLRTAVSEFAAVSTIDRDEAAVIAEVLRLEGAATLPQPAG